MQNSRRKIGRLVFERRWYGWSVDLRHGSERVYWPAPISIRERVSRNFRLGWRLMTRGSLPKTDEFPVVEQTVTKR